MPTSKSYHSYLIESLKDPIEAAAYLNIILEDGDLEHIALALRNVAEAQESLTDRSNNDQFDWKEYSQLFSNQEPTELLAIVALLNQLGLKLSVTVKTKQPA